jgi:plasmid stabilization system protein ParE
VRRRLELTEIARADLKSIRRHSIRTWGQDRTSQYMTAIRDTLKGLVRGTIVTQS